MSVSDSRVSHGRASSGSRETEAPLRATELTFWESNSVPSEDTIEFREFLYGVGASGGDSEPKHGSYWEPPESNVPTWSADNPRTYSSIGDQGTTASINVFGEVIQFSKWLDARAPGMFCVDQSHSDVDEPFLVYARASKLQSLATDRIMGNSDDQDDPDAFGLRILDIIPWYQPRVGYIGYRWPRYEYDTEEWRIATTWMVREGVVLQQCLLTNRTEEDAEVTFKFVAADGAMAIRDLDYIDRMNFFNERYKGYHQPTGPNGYSWCVMHQFSPDDDDENAAGQNEDQSAKQSANSINEEKGGIAVVVSIFLNGSPCKWSRRNSSWQVQVPGTLSGASSPATEITCAYKMIRVADRNVPWQDVLIPYRSCDVSEFLREEPCATNIALSTIQVPDGSSAVGEMEGDDPSNAEIAPDAQAPPQSPKIDRDRRLSISPFAIPHKTTSPASHIEFLVRRNLENILSNCAIPAVRTSKHTLPVPLEIDEEGGQPSPVVPVVLTCGDISGHRVCTSASFFAFWFLVEVAKRLKHLKSEDPYAILLEQRIATVCRGHVEWICQAETLTEKPYAGCFAANYWPTRAIMTGESNSWRAPESLTSTAFQVTKLAFYQQVFGDVLDERTQDRWGRIADVCHDWIRNMGYMDKRDSHAWPHAQDAETNVFRLDDHVWIWKGLCSIKDLDLWLPNWSQDDKALSRRFEPNHVQREMLRRFTTENLVSKKRMLAVTRSSRETRFLFHSRDTALFYGSKWDFFLEQTSIREVWANSIEAQVFHNGNQETGWDNALRYALAIVMGLRGHRINKRTPAALVQSSLDVLLRSVSINGFFSGLLDVATKEGVLFTQESDRDFYFHTSFEIPFILLDNAVRISEVWLSDDKEEDEKQRKQRQGARQDSLDHQAQTTLRETEKVVEVALGLAADPTLKPLEQEGGLVRQAVFKSGTFSMKKTVPYSRFIDASSIVNIDEEWLYNYPDFLSDTMITDEAIRELIWELLRQGTHGIGHFLFQAAQMHVKQDPSISWPPVPPSQFVGNRRAMVVDTPKKRHMGMGRQSKHQADLYAFVTNWTLKNILASPRTAQKAKKRFIFMPNADYDTALACYTTSPESERAAISLFFDRHADLARHFYDDTTMYLNMWETEIHLSFYQLLDADKKQNAGIPGVREEEFPGNRGKKITKAAMGFRFVGDYFDRYWTCHVIESVPAWEFDEEGEELPFEMSSGDKRSWRQRKVLELLLFERILTALVDSTREIYDSVRDAFGLQKGAFSVSITNSDDYFSADWEKFQHMLEAVEQELGASLLIISKWESRDRDRGQEKPRWTRNDEQKYGLAIKKLRNSTSRQVRDMRSLHDNIRALKDTLVSSQEHIRDDLGLRGAEDIRFFTYVTVVFLPLGFASSLFSMSEAPNGKLIASMGACAAVALALTLLALLNAKSIGMIIKAISNLTDRYYSFSRAKMRGSSLVYARLDTPREKRRGWRDKDKDSLALDDSATARNNDEEKGTITAAAAPKTRMLGPDPFSPPKEPFENAIYLWFWLLYLLIEWPAQRVALAYEALSHPRLSLHASFDIALGMLLLPFCILTWLLQILVYNLADLFWLVWGWMLWMLPTSSPEHSEIFSRNLKFLTRPPRASRPLRTLDSKFSALRKRWASVKKSAPAVQEVKGPEEKRVIDEKVMGHHSMASLGGPSPE